MYFEVKLCSSNPSSFIVVSRISSKNNDSKTRQTRIASIRNNDFPACLDIFHSPSSLFPCLLCIARPSVRGDPKGRRSSDIFRELRERARRSLQAQRRSGEVPARAWRADGSAVWRWVDQKRSKAFKRNLDPPTDAFWKLLNT